MYSLHGIRSDKILLKYFFLKFTITRRKTGPKVIIYKTFFILNSAENEIYLAYNVKMPTIVGILTFISMINTNTNIYSS